MLDASPEGVKAGTIWLMHGGIAPSCAPAAEPPGLGEHWRGAGAQRRRRPQPAPKRHMCCEHGRGMNWHTGSHPCAYTDGRLPARKPHQTQRTWSPRPAPQACRALPLPEQLHQTLPHQSADTAPLRLGTHAVWVLKRLMLGQLVEHDLERHQRPGLQTSPFARFRLALSRCKHLYCQPPGPYHGKQGRRLGLSSPNPWTLVVRRVSPREPKEEASLDCHVQECPCIVPGRPALVFGSS